MSITGIIPGGLFSSPVLQAAQKVAGWAHSIGKEFESHLHSNTSPGAQPIYASLQPKLALQSSNSDIESPVSTIVAQFGQDLNSGNSTAAQTDFSSIHQTLFRMGRTHNQPLSTEDSSSQTGANSLTDPLMAAFQAYLSPQNNPYNTALSSSLATDASALSIDA